MAKGSGAFVIAELVERLVEEGSQEDRASLKKVFGGRKVKEEIEDAKPKGWEVLCEKIDKL